MANQETLAFFKALQATFADDGTVLFFTSQVSDQSPSEGIYRGLIKALLNDKLALQKELKVSNNILKDANLYHLVLLEK